MTAKELEDIKKTWAVGPGETMFEGHEKVAIGRLIQEIERLREELEDILSYLDSEGLRGSYVDSKARKLLEDK